MPDQFSSEPGSLLAIGASVGLKLMAIFALVALALAVAGIAARYVQDQPTFTGERLNPKLNKLNPVEGFKRVFGKQAAASFLKSLAKLVRRRRGDGVGVVAATTPSWRTSRCSIRARFCSSSRSAWFL